MKNRQKMFLVLAVLVLLLLPVQVASARGLAEGPIFGGSFTLKSGETRQEDLIVFGGSVVIEKDARVEGAVLVMGGSFTSGGEVTKDVVVIGGAVKLESSAYIHGSLVTYGSTTSRDAGARVDGDVINNSGDFSKVVPNTPLVPSTPGLDIQQNASNSNPIWKAFTVLVESVMLALLAMLLAMFIPTQMRRVADAVLAQPLMGFAVGLLTTLGFIMVIAALAVFSLLIITLIITIPLIFLLSVLMAAASVFGWLALGMEVGERIARMFKGGWPVPLSAALGVFFFNLVMQGIGFIPCIGGLLSGVVGCAALGAVVMTRFATRVVLKPAVVIPAQTQADK